MTFAEFDALREQLRNKENREYYRTGMICAMIGNAHGGKGEKDPYLPYDFMPGGREENEPAEEVEYETPEETLHNLMELNRLFGGGSNPNLNK